MFKIKPKKGLKVRDPKTLVYIPEEGMMIEQMNTFYQRRMDAGDVTVEEIAADKKEKEAKK